ncbi:MAG: hypothetical protein IPP40_04580 [bacterium]|nr:hypothetical protein [bacterium]
MSRPVVSNAISGVFEGTRVSVPCDYKDRPSSAQVAAGADPNWDAALITATASANGQQSRPCQQCHIGGVFEGTPSQCIDCHLPITMVHPILITKQLRCRPTARSVTRPQIGTRA